MTIEVKSFSEIPQDEFQTLFDTYLQLLQEVAPNLDVKAGPLRDLLVYHEALYGALQRKELERLRNSLSLKRATEDPSLAETEVLDEVLANFLISRDSGSKAKGNIFINVNTKAPFTLEAGTRFIYGELVYVLPSTVNVVITSPSSPDDVLITDLSDGTYGVTVEVESEEVGSKYNIAKGSTFVVDPEPAYFLSAVASTNITGGADSQSNEELVQQAIYGISNTSLHSQTQIEAYLNKNGWGEVQVITVKDPEMIRDKHLLLPVGVGGKTDIYVANTDYPVSKIISTTATFVGTDLNEALWQVTINRDDFPAAYLVNDVLDANTGQSILLREVKLERTVQNQALDAAYVTPDVVDVQEAAFSYFQGIIYQFTDNSDHSTLTAYSSTKQVQLEVWGIEGIDTAQKLVSTKDNIPLGVDLLVKSFHPCFVKASCKIKLVDPALQLDEATLKEKVVEAIRDVPIGVPIGISHVMNRVQEVLPSQAVIEQVILTGTLYAPDKAYNVLPQNNLLSIPDLGVCTQRTTKYFIDTEDVVIST